MTQDLHLATPKNLQGPADDADDADSATSVSTLSRHRRSPRAPPCTSPASLVHVASVSCRQQVHYYTKQTISVGVYGRDSRHAIKKVRLYPFVLKAQNELQVAEERALVLICQDQVGLLTRLRLT